MKGIVSVQGQTVILPTPAIKIKPKIITFIELDRRSAKNCPEGHIAVMVNIHIAAWIEKQPIHMWKPLDFEKNGEQYVLGSHYIVSDELLTWLKLRWL